MIRRFSKVEGIYIERIPGQERFACGMSGSKDLYDLEEWAESGDCPGSSLSFFDFENGKVYTPFACKKNVLFGDPVYVDGFFYFLRADAGAKKVTLLRYLPENEPEAVWEKNMDEVSLYNLRVIGEELHVISQNAELFKCYYPESFSFPLSANETVVMISEGRVYIEAWIEEGWDTANARAGENYRFYNKILVKDFEGKLLSEETGSLNQSPDGNWWIS